MRLLVLLRQHINEDRIGEPYILPVRSATIDICNEIMAQLLVDSNQYRAVAGATSDVSTSIVHGKTFRRVLGV